MQEKETLRKRLLKKRAELDAKDALNKSNIITSRVIALREFMHAGSIAFYTSVKNEVDTSAIFKYAKALDKEIAFPKVHGEGIKFHIIKDLSELDKGRFGIPEPDSVNAEIRVKDVNLFLIPGVAFDKSGFRLGYGKGYYDRIVCDVKGFMLGLAFDFQIVETIHPSENDIKVDKIVTEKRIIDCRKKFSCFN
ncbi:MAG TPA: 5-formyltetrahydrofolate cyclo-ligase [bacterium]